MEHQSFWQFSDQLRLQTSALSNLSTNDSIWSNSFVSKTNNNNNNFDVRVGAELSSSNSNFNSRSSPDTFNNDGWNSFKSGGSGLLSSSLNPKALGSGNLKEAATARVNDYGWNSFKAGAGADLVSGNLSPNPIGSGTNVKDYGLWNGFKAKPSSDYINGFNDGWKFNSNGAAILGKNSKEIGVKGGNNFSKGLHYKLGAPANNGGNSSNLKSYRSNNGGGGKGEEAEQGGGKKKVKNEEKRFKTLPAAEALPRNELIGGYIFVCNNDTMAENLKRQLFGLPPRYRDSVRAITPGLPLFLYNYSTHQLHGVFEAASFGGTNIDPTAWEDKKCPGESRFPAQVRVITRKICEPLEEDSFRPILHHYDGPKFRLELSIPEAISLLDVLAHQNPQLSTTF